MIGNISAELSPGVGHHIFSEITIEKERLLVFVGKDFAGENSTSFDRNY